MKKVSYISLSCLCALAAVNSALAEDKTVKIRETKIALMLIGCLNMAVNL